MDGCHCRGNTVCVECFRAAAEQRRARPEDVGGLFGGEGTPRTLSAREVAHRQAMLAQFDRARFPWCYRDAADSNVVH
jgi:hypothetical protein